MIATGTDIKPLEIVMFMRTVKSRNLLRADEGPRRPRHQRHRLPGRHARRARARPTSCIVDSVGVTETELTDTQPLDRKPTVAARQAASSSSPFGNRDPDVLSSLAGRLARLDRSSTKPDREALAELAGGVSLARDRRAASSTRSTPTGSVDAARGRRTDATRPTTQVAAAAKQLARRGRRAAGGEPRAPRAHRRRRAARTSR